MQNTPQVSHPPSGIVQNSFYIREMWESDIADVVNVHLSSFQNFFLSFLGPRFLTLLYHEILREPGNVNLVAMSSDNEVIGFVAGEKDQVRFYQRLVKEKSFAFALASSSAVIRRPSIIPRLFRALRYAGKAKEASYPASLMSIAVLPAAKGKGAGKSLVKYFLNEMEQKGVKEVCLTTDRDNNENTNIFYRKLGFLVTHEYRTTEGRWMYEYSIHTDTVNTSSGRHLHKDTDIQIRFATLADIETLTNLHFSLFSPEEHVAMILGRRYIKAMHRWEVTSDHAYSLIAEVNGQAVGFQGVSDVPYTWPMFIHCFSTLVVCILQKPSFLFEKRLWERFLRHERSRGMVKIDRAKIIQLGVAQLIVGGVESRYRGKGIFHSLIESVKKISTKRGSNAIVSGVYKNNSLGRRVFIKYGWLESPVLETSETIFYATLFDSSFAGEIIKLLKLKTNHDDTSKAKQ